MVREPTRGRNTLDFVFTPDEELVRDVEVGPGLDGSDHRAVSFVVMVGGDPECERTGNRLNLRRTNYPRFVRALQELVVHHRDTTEELWSDFKLQYQRIQARCIATKRIDGTAKVNPSWFNLEVSAAITERKALYRATQADASPQLRGLYHRHRRLVKRLVRQAKATEENRVALSCNDNPKEFYAYVNSHKVRIPLGPLQTATGELASAKEDIAREFNSYFSSVFTAEADGLPAPIIVFDGEEPLEELVINEQAVYDKLTQLDPNKAPGPVGFLPKVMRAVARGLAPTCAVFL